MEDPILSVLALIFFIVISLRKLEFSLGFILIFLSTYLVRFEIGSIPLTFLEVMIFVVFAVWLIKVIIKKEKIYLSSFFWPAMLFLLTGIIAVFVSPDIKAALGIYKAYFIEPILYFVVLINVIKDREKLKFIIFSLGMSSLFVSVYAVWQYFGIFPGIEPYISEMPKRVTSFFEFPTAVGKFLAPIMALFLAMIFVKLPKYYRRSISHKLYLWGIALFSILAILFSVTRGAIVALFFAFIFISFFSRHKKIIWISTVIILLVFLALPWGRSQVTDIVSGTDTSTDVHVTMWQGTWRMLKANPVTGAGLAGFPEVYDQYRDAAHVELFPYPDNLFLAIWSELGLAGLVVFAWIFFKFIKENVALFRKKLSPFSYQITVGLLASAIVIVVHGVVDTPYFKNDLSIMFWAFVAILVILKRVGLKRTEKEMIHRAPKEKGILK